MKKSSKLMRASGILLVLTLITSCFVGGTFAKYVSEGTGEDSARVAKWGVEVAITGDGFKTTYEKDDTSSGVTGNTVISLGSDKVVAPGTTGQFGGITISGKPEVAVKIVTSAEVTLSGWNIASGNEFYCPLVFTIGDKTICGLHYSTSTAGGEGSFQNAIKKAIEDATTQEIAAGTDLSTVGENIKYSWAWPFDNAGHTSCDSTDSEKSTSHHNQPQTDTLDTLLGNNAADNDPGNDPTIKITVKTTVTQIN